MNEIVFYDTLRAGLWTAVIVSLPILWMLTVSVRPNLEVMKIPPSWIPIEAKLAKPQSA